VFGLDHPPIFHDIPADKANDSRSIPNYAAHANVNGNPKI